VEREDAPPVTRAVEDVVDDQRDVVQQLDRGRRTDDLVRRKTRCRPSIAREDGRGTVALGAAAELALDHRADLLVGAAKPVREDVVQPADFHGEPETVRKLPYGATFRR
jgi:hypothetical protein